MVLEVLNQVILHQPRRLDVHLEGALQPVLVIEIWLVLFGQLLSVAWLIVLQLQDLDLAFYESTNLLLENVLADRCQPSALDSEVMLRLVESLVVLEMP